MDNLPLVSIVIITYNSARFVRETLDSAIAQTYQNIEIIISDDRSNDNTVNVVQEWIKSISNSGIRIELIEANVNTGTAGNCNRGLQAARGEWIKIIAGDDILLPDAIESYICFTSHSSDIKIVISRVLAFNGESPNYFVKKRPVYLKYFFYLNDRITAHKQYKILCHSFVGSGPAFFANTAALKDVGGYDTRFPLQEDYPIFIKLTKHNYRFYLLDKETVMWRANDDSVTHKKENSKVIFGNHRVRVVKEYKYGYLMEELTPFGTALLRFSLWLQNKIIDTGNSYHSFRSLFYFYLYRLVDPFIWSCRFYVFIDLLMKKERV